MEQGLTRQQVFSLLAKSPHGKLDEYFPVGSQACREDPEFFSHLIAWNGIKGEIRDAKVALPIVALATMRNGDSVPEFVDNAEAHLALLPPRDLLRGARAKQGRMRSVRRLVEKYLRAKESNAKSWDRMALQHRGSLKELYALFHVAPSPRANRILFQRQYPDKSVFADVARLKDMSPLEAAGTIVDRKIPFLIAVGALGPKAKDKDVLIALIDKMTPAQLTNNMKKLERLGVKNDPALKAALEQALSKARMGKGSALKLTKAVESLGDDELREKARAVQEAKLSRASVEGDWAVLCDRSNSMEAALPVALQIAAILARMAAGKVHLVFFSSEPQYLDVTGLTLEQIQKATRYMRVSGATSIGCGLNYLLANGIQVDGIAIVSDAQENTPPHFAGVMEQYSKAHSKQVPVYLYRLQAAMHGYLDRDLAQSMSERGLDLSEFDLQRQNIDYHSLPNLVQTMRTNRYSLIDEVMAAPLLRLEDVLRGELKVRKGA